MVRQKYKKSTIGSKNPIMGILEENKTFISSRPVLKGKRGIAKKSLIR